MTRPQKHPHRRVRIPADRQAFQGLAESLEQNPGFANAEQIRLMRRACGAEVDELQKTGEVKIPK